MAGTMRSPGPDTPDWASIILMSMQDAISALQTPGAPQRMAQFKLKTNLPPAASYKECVAICDEINSVVVSTSVAGTYTWLRANGSAL